MRIREFLEKLEQARGLVQREISGNAGGGRLAAGMAGEGYAGGYLQALDDVQAVLTHGAPSDPRSYWRERR